MAEKFKVISIRFAIDSPPLPFHIVADVERYYNRKGCAVSLQAFAGDVFILTLRGEDIVDKVKSQNILIIANKVCQYKEEETNITAIRVDLKNSNRIAKEEITYLLRRYGKILDSDIVVNNSINYFAIIELNRDLPSRMMLRIGCCDVFELV